MDTQTTILLSHIATYLLGLSIGYWVGCVWNIDKK